MRFSDLKTVLFGRPLASDEADHELLRKRLALPVFSSDALSSVAYATEEMMLVLALVGVAAFSNLLSISTAVATLMVIVVVSYRQTIRAYPGGGGSFTVSLDNLGLLPATVAAGSLLTDYVLTVSVSVSAGVAAISSAFPAVLEHRVALALGFVVLLTVANLRGTRESSLVFAVPTYAFVATVFAMLLLGIGRCLAEGCPQAISSGAEIEPEVAGLTLFLVLRAFASGSTALTGVEAISNGVQAFREPKAHNAIVTLTVMGGMAVTMFLGIGFLADRLNVRISEATVNQYGTVISQIGRAVFGDGVVFFLLQAFTAGILVLAANTSYQDFPRLSAILANHRLLPRQFRNRGDRLVFSNGVVALAVIAGLLIVAFDAEVTRLIQLYVVGVFLSFTLSQTGMVRHWIKSNEPRWRLSAAINAIGAIATGVVLVVVAAVKFAKGAWVVIVLIPLLVWMMLTIRRHYIGVGAQLRRLPVDATVRPNRVIMLVAHIDEATDRAFRFADTITRESITYLHAEEPDSDDCVYSWHALHPERTLTLLPGEGESVVRRVIRHIRLIRDENPGSTITVVIAERFAHRTRWDLFRHPRSLALKARLLFEPRVVVTDLTLVRTRRRQGLTPVPVRHLESVVLVSDLTRPIREAITYAIGLGAPVRAVHIDVDDVQRERLLAAWEEAGFDLPLDVVASPYRSIVAPLIGYLRDRRRQGLPGTLINAVIPEFVVPGRVGQFLHNQTGLAIKAALIAELRIIVTSVPFHLAAALEEEA